MELPFRVEERESFRVIGHRIRTTNKGGAGRKAIPAQWGEFKTGNLQSTLMPLMNREPFGLFGISVYNVDEKDARIFDHYIAVSSDYEGEAFASYVVPAASWAVFPCTADTLGQTEVQAISKWLPKSDYKPLNRGYLTGRMKAGAPDLEYYGEDGTAEVWVAVKKK